MTEERYAERPCRPERRFASGTIPDYTGHPRGFSSACPLVYVAPACRGRAPSDAQGNVGIGSLVNSMDWSAGKMGEGRMSECGSKSWRRVHVMKQSAFREERSEGWKSDENAKGEGQRHALDGLQRHYTTRVRFCPFSRPFL